MLMRIVALLFSLADLADRAAGMPLDIRYHVLWILRPAEAVARHLVLRELQNAAVISDLPLSEPPLWDDSPPDALRLAKSFRALALTLWTLALEIENLQGGPAPTSVRTPPPGPCFCAPAVPAPPCASLRPRARASPDIHPD